MFLLYLSSAAMLGRGRKNYDIGYRLEHKRKYYKRSASAEPLALSTTIHGELNGSTK